MNNSYKKLLKNIGILTISNFSSKILVFLLVPIYTSALSTEEYGVYDLVSTTVTLLFPILTLNIVDAVMRFTMDNSKEKKSVVTVGFKYIVISATIGAVFCAFMKYIPLFGQVEGYEWLAYMYFVFYILNQLCIQLAKGLEQVKTMGIASVIGTLTTILVNIIMLCVFKCGLKGFFIANVLAQMVPVMYYVFKMKIWQYIDIKVINRDLEGEMLKYCTPLIFTVVGWWVNSSLDRYIVTAMMGVAANGLLSIAYKIPSIINVVQSIFMQAWQISAISEYGQEETKKFYTNAFGFLNFGMVLSSSIIIIMTRPIAKMLYANEFYNAWRYVPFLVISGVINAASGFCGAILSAQKNTSIMARSAIYGSIVNAVFNVALIAMIGIQGATIATVISSYIIYIMRRMEAKKEMEFGNYIRIMVSWILLCVQAIVEIYMGYYMLELMFMIIILIMYRENLKKIVKRKRVA